MTFSSGVLTYHLHETATDIPALFCEVNPIPVKYALNVLGFDFGLPRLPLCELSSKNKVLLDNLLKK